MSPSLPSRQIARSKPGFWWEGQDRGLERSFDEVSVPSRACSQNQDQHADDRRDSQYGCEYRTCRIAEFRIQGKGDRRQRRDDAEKSWDIPLAR